MDNNTATNSLPPQSFSSPRHLPTHGFAPYSQHGQSPHTPLSYSAHHLDPSLQPLDTATPFHATFGQQIDDDGTHRLHSSNSYAHRNVSSPQQNRGNVRFQEIIPQRQHNGPGHSFNMFNAHAAQMEEPSMAHRLSQSQVQQGNTVVQEQPPSRVSKQDGGHFPGMKIVPDAPGLDAWRQKLFDVEETITMTEEEFQTYFPHVDNVYSHRSTQRYKRKPFVSHYWDCRLKGRPPGTPKSDDPNKKKRKRQARERDLCDVKIKITEYFPGARAFLARLGEDASEGAVDNVGSTQGLADSDSFGIAAGTRSFMPGSEGERYYTIAKVNGGNATGKGDGILGGHRHTLEESDRIKKSSVQRQVLKDDKEKKKVQKSYHKKATGIALQTVKKHTKDSDLKLYGSCFCPFVQRVWIALEAKAIAYQYIEVDPYRKPQSLLALNPLGLVPALQHGTFSCHESTVLLEYLEDAFPEQPIFSTSAQERAHARLWADHVNRKLIPAFYHTLQAQETSKQAESAAELKAHIQKLVENADPEGPFFAGPRIGWVDMQLAPWLLRLSRVLGPYRGWPATETGSRWGRWVEAVEANEHVKATVSGDELYKDSYERYAENRPGTSQVADAVNSGRGLP